MKKLIILTLLLSGCARLTYDSTEFNQLISINESATEIRTACGTPDQYKRILVLQKDVNHFNHYETLRTSRKSVAIISVELNSMVNELAAKYENSSPSVTYCAEKMKSIIDGTNTIISTLGGL